MGRFSSELILLLVLVLAVDCRGDWQARGNMSDDNVTIVRQKIDNAMRWFPSRTSDDAAKNISKELNDLWSPAWNVVFVINYSQKVFEAIVNGYAYRDHWLWFNNYTSQVMATSIIIWKDYNCKQWVSLQTSLGSLNTTTANHMIIASNIIQNSQFLINDPWAFSQSLLVKMYEADPNHAYTIVVADQKQVMINGAICVDTEGTQLQYATGTMMAYYGGQYRSGAYLIMRTR